MVVIRFQLFRLAKLVGVLNRVTKKVTTRLPLFSVNGNAASIAKTIRLLSFCAQLIT